MGRTRPGPESQLSCSFLLHSSQPTRLMNLYPKLRVTPLPLEVQPHTQACFYRLFFFFFDILSFSEPDRPQLLPEVSSTHELLNVFSNVFWLWVICINADATQTVL